MQSSWLHREPIFLIQLGRTRTSMVLFGVPRNPARDPQETVAHGRRQVPSIAFVFSRGPKQVPRWAATSTGPAARAHWRKTRQAHFDGDHGCRPAVPPGGTRQNNRRSGPKRAATRRSGADTPLLGVHVQRQRLAKQAKTNKAEKTNTMQTKKKTTQQNIPSRQQQPVKRGYFRNAKPNPCQPKHRNSIQAATRVQRSRPRRGPCSAPRVRPCFADARSALTACVLTLRHKCPC